VLDRPGAKEAEMMRVVGLQKTFDYGLLLFASVGENGDEDRLVVRGVSR
jgi:hypothetical protein